MKSRKFGNDASVGRVTSRRSTAPWSVRELEQAFRIADANGQAGAYTYFRKDENEARQASARTALKRPKPAIMQNRNHD